MTDYTGAMGGPGIGHKQRRAAELGMDLDAYLGLIETHKWCSRCKAFHLRELFVADVSRQDGLAAKCAPPATAPGPARPDRRAMLERGWFWCKACQAWWPITYRVNAECKPHARAATRRRYHETDFGDRWRAKVRARQRGIALIEPGLRREVMAMFDGRCAYCPRPAVGLDHWWPVSHGGGAMTHGNLVPACAFCNASKGNTTDLGRWLNDDIVDHVERAILHFALGDEEMVDA